MQIRTPKVAESVTHHEILDLRLLRRMVIQYIPRLMKSTNMLDQTNLKACYDVNDADWRDRTL